MLQCAVVCVLCLDLPVALLETILSTSHTWWIVNTNDTNTNKGEGAFCNVCEQL